MSALFFTFAGTTASATRFTSLASLPDFGAQLFYPQLAGDFSQAVATADLNGDGRADLIVGQRVGVKVAFGDGNGGMSAAVLVGTGSGPNSIAVADLDGDNDLDLVTSNHSGGSGTTFSVLFNDGGGTFGVENTYTVPAGHRSLKVTTGDVSGNPRPEVIALSDKLVMVWNNDGSGGLTAGFSRAYTTPNCCYHSGYSAVRVAKVTNDQLADLVVTVNTYDGGNEPQLQIMPGAGGGNFGATTYHRYPNVATTNRPAFHTTEVEVADIDNDGDVDVMAGAQASHNRLGSHLVVMRNDGSGVYPTANGSSHALGYVNSTSVLAGDLNDDGKVDMLGTLSGGFTYFLNDGAGNFPAGVSNWAVGDGAAATLADLNGSGQGSLEVVIVRNNAVFTLLNGTVTDTTAPAIAVAVDGTQTGGWYTSDVTVAWTVTDAESEPSASGCQTQSVTSDTDGVTFTCTATSLGGETSRSVTIKRDTTGPVIASVTASPGMLWAPNHQMHAVTVSADATDAGAGTPVCSVDSVSSNEGGNQHEPDVQLTGALSVNLRAERDGNGAGRIYTLYVSCKDAIGNTSNGSATVTVAHDQGKGKK